MKPHYLFISYKRGLRSTRAMRRFYNRAQVELGGLGVETFLDRHSIDVGAEWSVEIQSFLGKTTLFLACVSIDYWLSEPCMNELTAAIDRYEASKKKSPKLLLVLGDKLDPSSLAIENPRQTCSAAATNLHRLRHLGQINFLGPYDADSGMLVPLKLQNEAACDRQIAAMISTIRKGLRAD